VRQRVLFSVVVIMCRLRAKLLKKQELTYCFCELEKSSRCLGGSGGRNEFQKCNYGTKEGGGHNFIFPLAEAYDSLSRTNYTASPENFAA